MFETDPIAAVERIVNKYQRDPAYEEVKHDADIVLGIRLRLDKRRVEGGGDLAKGKLQTAAPTRNP